MYGILYVIKLFSFSDISLPSLRIVMIANRIFVFYQSIQLFISVPLDASGIDYHVALAQNALHQCLMQVELQNELLCQLMKQTARHSYHKPGVQVCLWINVIHRFVSWIRHYIFSNIEKNYRIRSFFIFCIMINSNSIIISILWQNQIYIAISI